MTTTTNIQVKTCIKKREGIDKDGKPYVIYEITDILGTKYDAFDEFKEAESVQVEVAPDTSGKGYNAKIKRTKSPSVLDEKNLVAKDTKRETALTCAVAFKTEKPLNSDDVLKLADKMYNWLKS